MDTASDTDTARGETFRLLFDAISLPAWICDAETPRFREANATAVAAYGYAREGGGFEERWWW
jgi:PAS domain-containing protein